MLLLNPRRRMLVIAACVGLLTFLLAVHDDSDGPVVAHEPMIVAASPRTLTVQRAPSPGPVEAHHHESRLWVGGGSALHGFVQRVGVELLRQDQVAGTAAAVMDALSAASQQSTLLSDDDRSMAACIVTLPPTLTLACRVLRLRNEQAYLASWCAHLDRCVLWSRGVYTSPINGTYLMAVQQGMDHDQRRRQAQSGQPTAEAIHDTLFVHTSRRDIAKEALWLPQRMHVHLLDVQAQQQHLEAAGRSVANHGGVPQLGDDADTIDVASLFPHHRSATVDWERQHVVVDGVAAPRLTALQMAAYLYGLQHPMPPPTSPHPALPLDILLFSGDSTLREMFLRLVHHMRHGDDPSVPFFDLPTWGDVVYAMFERDDALFVLDSPFSRKTPRRTVREQLKALQGDGTPSRRPLLTLVFLFSKRTKQDYRKEVWSPNHAHRLDANVRLLVEGTLFWEPQRDPAFLKMWTHAASMRVQRGDAGHPFVALMGHPTYEPCRVGRCDLVPQRVFRNKAAAPTADPVAGIAQLLAQGTLNRSLVGVVNAHKNVALLHWMEYMHRQVQLPSPTLAWRTLHALDKAKMTMVPGGVLPTDHIHLACRLIAPGKLDVVQQTRSNSVHQWRTMLAAGKGAQVDATVQRTTTSSAEMEFWDSLIRQLDAHGVTTLKLPPETAPQRDAWAAVGGKRGSGRYVHFTHDGRGCVDIGNRVLLEAMLRRLGGSGGVA